VVALFAIVVAAALAGWLLVREISPQYLQAELQTRLSEALDTSVTIEKITVSSTGWLQLDARGLRAWPDEQGFGLEIPRVVGSVDPLSLLVGKLRLRRLRMEGAVLRVGAIGWSGLAGSAREATRAPEPRNPHERRRPLIALETALRSLLEAPGVATVLELQDGRIELDAIDATLPASLQLSGASGRLVRHRFSGESELSVRGQLREAERDLGAIALTGERSRGGRMRIVLGLESLALGVSDAYLGELGSDARVDGAMSGEILYETPEPGSGHLVLDLVCDDLRSTILAAGEGSPKQTRLPRVDINASLVITPQSVAAHEAVIRTPRTTLRMTGTVARPLESASMADLSLEFDDVEVSQVRHLIGWLPEIEREEAAAVVAPLRSGRLVSLRASGGASLAGWQDFLAGRTRTLPEDFRLGAELANTVVTIGDSDRIEQLSGRLQWIGGRVAIVGATALLNGSALPSLDLVVDGFPNFFAVDPAARELVSDAASLAGLATLWRSLRLTPESDSAGQRVTIDLQIEDLDHPLFLWPIRDLELALESEADGIHIQQLSGTWAGVPIAGRADWSFRPEERVSVNLSAQRPSDRPAASIAKSGWAHGRFSVGAIEGERWWQSAARGEFEASGDRVRIRDLAVDLEPSGAIEANATLRLSAADAVPFLLSFDLKSGNANALAKLFGLPSNQIHGTADLAGSFDGALRPDTSIYAALRGLLSVRARDGVIRKKAPPVAAVSQASEELEDYDPNEVIPYRHFETVLEFGDGRIHTDAFSMEGPELGVFASGDVELLSHDKRMDGKVALFLFPKLDRVLGKIPILSQILLGTDENLVATYYEVSGPWDSPDVKPIFLPGSAGPTSVVLQGVPLFVKRGFQALGSLITPDSAESDEDSPAKPATP